MYSIKDEPKKLIKGEKARLGDTIFIPGPNITVEILETRPRPEPKRVQFRGPVVRYRDLNNATSGRQEGPRTITMNANEGVYLLLGV